MIDAIALKWRLLALKRQAELEDVIKDNNQLKRSSEKTERKISYYMTKNHFLWCALMKLPGGTEAARKASLTDEGTKNG